MTNPSANEGLKTRFPSLAIFLTPADLNTFFDALFRDRFRQHFKVSQAANLSEFWQPPRLVIKTRDKDHRVHRLDQAGILVALKVHIAKSWWLSI